MKRISLLLLTGFCFFATACSDDDEETGLGLEINAADTGFDADGGEGGISIASLGEVNAVADKDWIEITSVAADSVHFRVEPNPDELLRTGKITVTGTDGREEVTILQKGFYFTMEVPDEGIEFSGLGGEKHSVALEYGMRGALDITFEGGESWLAVTQEDGRIVFTGDMNETNEARSATVTVKAGWKSVEVKVTQDAIEWVKFSETALNVTETGLELIFLGDVLTANGVITDAEIGEYDPDWTLEKRGEWDWISTDDRGLNFSFSGNEGKSRHVAADIVARGKVVQSVTIWQYPIDSYGEYFEGKWIMHSVDVNSVPQATELTVSRTSGDKEDKNFTIIGFDQKFGDRHPVAATLGSSSRPGMQMMTQSLFVEVGDGVQYRLDIGAAEVSFVSDPYIIRDTRVPWGWDILFDRDTETLVFMPNDDMNDFAVEVFGMPFPGIGLLASYNGWMDLGMGFYFPDPSRNAIWLEKVAE